YEDLRERRPAAPHLDRKTAPPTREIAAVLEVLVGDVRLLEGLAHALHMRVLCHSDDDDGVVSDCLLDFADRLRVERVHLRQGRSLYARRLEDGAIRHVPLRSACELSRSSEVRHHWARNLTEG